MGITAIPSSLPALNAQHLSDCTAVEGERALSIPCPEQGPKPRSYQDDRADKAVAENRPSFPCQLEPFSRNVAEPFLSGPAWGLRLSPVSVPSRRLAQKLCLVSPAAATRGKGQRVLRKALASALSEDTHKAAGSSASSFQRSRHEQAIRLC